MDRTAYHAPVIIPSDSAGTMMATVGTDDQVYTSSTQDPGGLGVTWRKVSSLPDADPRFPMSYVAGAGLLGETGAMANAVVLAYNSWATGAIYIRVQNQDGSVAFHDWDPITAIYIPGDRVPMAVGISMAWPPKHSLPGSQRKLIMVGQTNEDGLVYISGNTFSNGVYNHAGWSNFVPMQLPGAGALVVAATTVDSIAFPTRPCTSRNTTARRVDGARGRGPRAARSCPVSPAI